MTRYRFSFWLNDGHETDHEVAAVIADMKQGRCFTAAIRDGLRLIADLRAGRVDWLLYLFPWVKDALQPPAPAQDTSTLQRQLDELKALLLQQGSLPGGPLVAAPALKGPKALNAPALDLPRFDEDDDGETLVIRKDTSTNAAQNFLNSMLALQQ